MDINMKSKRGKNILTKTPRFFSGSLRSTSIPNPLRRGEKEEVGDTWFGGKTCNNDKNLSEIQLEHEKEDELVAVVVKVVHELDCMMVVKEIENELLEEVEKLEWWFEQGIDDEGEEDEEDGGGDEV
ncbi:hypothetical protein Tco_0635567 [Tanacetum coccineum]